MQSHILLRPRIKTVHSSIILMMLGFLLFPLLANGQETGDIDPELQVTHNTASPVKLDGKILFYVNGVSSFPASLRASTISKRIRKAASDTSIPADSVKIIPENDHIKIYAGHEFIMNIYETDAQQEGVRISLLAEIVVQKSASAIESYRYDRSRQVLLKKALYALGSIILFSAGLFILLWLMKRINAGLQKRIKASVDNVENKSFRLIKSSQLWKAINLFIKIFKTIFILIVSIAFSLYLLGLFPWTRSIEVFITDILVNPLRTFAIGIINYLPSLVFLIIIFTITRYILKLANILSAGVARGGIVIKNFDPEWAKPTLRIVRVFIIAFAVVVAYPYIPGSGTNAFKGISVFAGLILSLGSSSFIGNLIAGYSMTYRRAFRKGDLIRVGEHTGFVEELQILVTRLHSIKNEEIVIPNSMLQNSNITNFSTMAKGEGVIMHTRVGIGYETPWRQVDAMLVLAAERTEGLLKQPAPFVLKESLGDFAVNYVICAYCKDTANLHFHYSHLHQNILDIFNENNVQIMTPAYMSDPESPKVVPKDLWEIPLRNK